MTASTVKESLTDPLAGGGKAIPQAAFDDYYGELPLGCSTDAILRKHEHLRTWKAACEWQARRDAEICDKAAAFHATHDLHAACIDQNRADDIRKAAGIE